MEKETLENHSHNHCQYRTIKTNGYPTLFMIGKAKNIENVSVFKVSPSILSCPAAPIEVIMYRNSYDGLGVPRLLTDPNYEYLCGFFGRQTRGLRNGLLPAQSANYFYSNDPF